MLIAGAAIVVGFAVLIWSADLFVDGAASIAENLGLSPIIIGLTIVSIGTSAPEILVSVNATLTGSGPLAIGNAIGSNIANVGLVLGITVLAAPLMVDSSCMRKEIPVLVAVTLGCGLLLLDSDLSRLDGSLMLGALLLLMVLMIRAQSSDEVLIGEAGAEPLPHLPPVRAWLTFLVGLVLLIASSRLLVFGAVTAARELGVSELVIGLTIIAIGTSLPELAATLASALRGHTEIALGNIIGSNLFNLLAVMSIPGVIDPQILEPEVTGRDYATMTFLTLFMAAAIFISRRRKASVRGRSYVGRTVGVLLVSFYALYYYLLYSTL
jgi:cation:H+ antiporter